MEQPAEQQPDSTAREMQLDLLRRGLAISNYPDYPSERLVMDLGSLARTTLGRLVLPDGPWTVNTHPNRRDTESAPSQSQQDNLLAEDLEFDSVGRPLHPWLSEMLSDTQLGIITGKGAYWQWGPNRTVDPVVIQDKHVLLIKRGDTGNWALPGGFIDKNETSDQAGRREVSEETGINIGKAIVSRAVYTGPVADIRVTANAWPETAALLYKLADDHTLPETRAADDAIEAAWVPLDTVEQDGQLFGSHRFLLHQALAKLKF